MSSHAPEPVVPFVRIDRVGVDDLTLTDAAIVADLIVHNPGAHGIEAARVRYTLTCGDERVVGGLDEADGTFIGPRASAMVTLRFGVRLDELTRVCADAAPGCLALYTLGVRLDVADSHRHVVMLAASTVAELPLPLAPAVSVRSLRFDALTWNRAEGRAVVRLASRCAFPVEAERLDVRIALDGSARLSGQLPGRLSLDALEVRDVSVPFIFCPATQGFAAFTSLHGRSIPYHAVARLRCVTHWGSFACSGEHRGLTALESSAASVAALAPLQSAPARAERDAS